MRYEEAEVDRLVVILNSAAEAAAVWNTISSPPWLNKNEMNRALGHLCAHIG